MRSSFRLQIFSEPKNPLSWTLMVLILGLIVFNCVGGFLVNLSSATFPADFVFAAVSCAVWLLLKDQSLVVPDPQRLAIPRASSFQGWSSVSRLEFAEHDPEMIPEPLTRDLYRYRVQFIAWPPNVEVCALKELDLFLSHLRKGRAEKVLILTQVAPSVAVQDVQALATRYGVSLISDVERGMNTESLPEAADFHRVLVFGPAQKRVRWEIALHRLFEKKASLRQKKAQEIQI